MFILVALAMLSSSGSLVIRLRDSFPYGYRARHRSGGCYFRKYLRPSLVTKGLHAHNGLLFIVLTSNLNDELWLCFVITQTNNMLQRIPGTNRTTNLFEASRRL
jgi:hypothetical protein